MRLARGLIAYVAKHWRGEYPLVFAFWVTGLLFLSPLSVALSVAQAVRGAGLVLDPSEEFWLIIVPLIADIVVAPWCIVGIWRSAGNRIREGHRVPGLMVRTLMGVRAALYIVIVLMLASTSFPGFRVGKLASDVIIHGYTILQRNRIVSFAGQITPRSVEELGGMFASGRVRTMAMSNAGGSLQAALDLAKMVRDKGLIILVSGWCDEACAVVLAASPRRVVREGTYVWVSRPQRSASAHAGVGTLAALGLITHVLDANRQLVDVDAWCKAHPAECGQ